MTETRAKTAADYAATAVAPVLIFLMISSLANFLMLVLYHGGHPQRVAWTLMMFTLGTVGIARVAIEKDRAYSLGYAGILGFVAFLAMLRFVDSPIFSAFILVVIAYLSDRIVHDCTLIDDSVDASGQGLIDSGRLFVKKQIESSANSSGPTIRYTTSLSSLSTSWTQAPKNILSGFEGGLSTTVMPYRRFLRWRTLASISRSSFLR